MSRKHSGRKTGHQTHRREFLKTMMLGSGAAAVALLTPRAQAQTRPEAEAAPAPETKGYHETAHIRDYYYTAGL